MGKLTDKVAVVTGASKGIGAEIAKAFAAEGAAVAVNYAASRRDADAVVADITAMGGKAHAIQADVSKSADVKHLIADTVSTFGRIDVLVNNAGIYRFSPIEAVSEDDFHQHFNINVLGVLLVTKEAIKHFGPDGGNIINLSTTVTRNPPAGASMYVASKSAIEGMTRVLAKELGPRKIRVNAISPGEVETEGTRTAGIVGSDFEKLLLQQTPLGRVGQPNDIAPVAVFLASDDARWVTGEILAASGGLRLKTALLPLGWPQALSTGKVIHHSCPRT
jgi:3-oxoacyl-[acyl-carrier protein] reductase